jgi:hypothetical protein
VRAEILNGEKLSADVIKRQLRAVSQFNGCSAAGRQVLDPTDDYFIAGTIRFLIIVVLAHVGKNRNKAKFYGQSCKNMYK